MVLVEMSDEYEIRFHPRNFLQIVRINKQSLHSKILKQEARVPEPDDARKIHCRFLVADRLKHLFREAKLNCVHCWARNNMLQKFSDFFLSRRKWLIILAFVNLAGFLFGIRYYWFQLSSTPPLLWMLMIDNPLYVLLFGMACLALLREKELPGWYGFVTAIGLIKVGFWTDLVLGLYWPTFHLFDPVISTINFPLHAGMILEGILLLPRFRVKAWYVPPVLLWFLGGDIFDYLFGTVTRIPPGYEWLLFPESLVASLVLGIGIFLLQRSRKSKEA